MNPLISVIIPVYNHAHTLKRCIEDVLAQTYKPIEIIIVNDGSTDNFAEVISIFKNPEIKIFNQANLGASAARNRGFIEAKGEYVIFWDADTAAKPDMLEKMHKALQNNPQASYAYSQFKFGWKAIRSHTFDPELLKKINYIDTTSLIRRPTLPIVPFDQNLKRFQDWDLWLTLLAQNKIGIFIPEILYQKKISERRGISAWLPRFVYRLMPNLERVKKYNQAKDLIFKKHNLWEKPS